MRGINKNSEPENFTRWKYEYHELSFNKELNHKEYIPFSDIVLFFLKNYFGVENE